MSPRKTKAELAREQERRDQRREDIVALRGFLDLLDALPELPLPHNLYTWLSGFEDMAPTKVERIVAAVTAFAPTESRVQGTHIIEFSRSLTPRVKAILQVPAGPITSEEPTIVRERKLLPEIAALIVEPSDG